MSTIILHPEDIPPEEPKPDETGVRIKITREDIDQGISWTQWLSNLLARIGSWFGLSKAPQPQATDIQLPPSVPLVSPEPVSSVVTLSQTSEPTPICPYCQNPIIGPQTRTCDECRTVHHYECWNANHGCTTLGCKHNPLTKGA